MLGFLGIGARTSKSVSTFASGPATKSRAGGSRHDPERIRYGCFLPDLTGLASASSAPSPEADIGRIWPECESGAPAVDRGTSERGRPARMAKPAQALKCGRGARAPRMTKGRLPSRKPALPLSFAVTGPHTPCSGVNLRRSHDPAQQLVTMRHWITSFRICVAQTESRRGFGL
jgi:hypothetical protein